jgi:hypothetical protein
MGSDVAAQPLLTTLAVDHPEWRPLLVVIRETLREMQRDHWRGCVPAMEHDGRGGRPLLDGAAITLARTLIERWIARILGP